MIDRPHEFDEILRRHCRFLTPDAEIDPHDPLTNLGADSLDVVELIVSIEDEFDISFPEELLTPQVFATPATVWNAVCTLVDADGARAAARASGHA